MIRPNRHDPSRKGISAFEVMLVLPLVVLILLAAVQFSATMTAEDRLAEASRQAARVAATNGDEIAIRNAVRDAIGNDAGDKATTTIKYVNSDDTAKGVAVQVTVSVPAKYLTPNYLRIIGYDNSDDELVGTTVMRMESVK